LTAFFQDNLGKPAPERQTILDYNEAKDDGVAVESDGPCKSSALHSRQITVPAPHHSIFYRPDTLPDTQPTVSKH